MRLCLHVSVLWVYFSVFVLYEVGNALTGEMQPATSKGYHTFWLHLTRRGKTMDHRRIRKITEEN